MCVTSQIRVHVENRGSLREKKRPISSNGSLREVISSFRLESFIETVDLQKNSKNKVTKRMIVVFVFNNTAERDQS